MSCFSQLSDDWTIRAYECVGELRRNFLKEVTYTVAESGNCIVVVRVSEHIFGLLKVFLNNSEHRKGPLMTIDKISDPKRMLKSDLLGQFI